MNEPQPKPSMKNDVLKAIQAGQVKMRPKWQFITKAALMVLGVVLAALATLYLVSFIVFILRQTGVLFVPAFGPGAFGVFFMSLPWLLILLAAVFDITLFNDKVLMFFFINIGLAGLIVKRYHEIDQSPPASS